MGQKGGGQSELDQYEHRPVQRGVPAQPEIPPPRYRDTSFAILAVANMAGSKLVLEAEISIKCFILGLSVLIIPSIRKAFGHVDLVFDYLTGTPGKIVISLYIAVINGLLLTVYKGPLYKVTR